MALGDGECGVRKRKPILKRDGEGGQDGPQDGEEKNIRRGWRRITFESHVCVCEGVIVKTE